MSAFAVIYERTDTITDPIVFNRIMERLNHRGPDGNKVVSIGSITMGHWHFWTTPEEVGERQPLTLSGLPFKIVFDGRIDNREEIFAHLNITPVEGKSLSDAALILHAYAQFGSECFKDFVGEFAIVILDEQKNELVCVRDHFGNRTLFYQENATRFVIASEPWAVLGIDDTKPRLNENTAAYYFAIKTPADGQTFFENVYELLPAHCMSVNASSHNAWLYWAPDPSKKTRFKTEQEYADRFLSLLEESVRCRMRSTTPVGVLMSGGLDSSSVACLAARMIAPAPLMTISYVFNELTDCDERKYIDAVREQWGIHSIQIPCDDLWPYKDWESWPHHPNQPEGNAYRLLKERAYKSAQDEGLRVLLTGGAGDRLYIAGREWLADLILDGKLRDAWRGIRLQIKYNGLKRVLQQGHIRIAMRRLLEFFFPVVRRLHRKEIAPAWLSPFSISFLHNEDNLLSPTLERHSTLLGLYSAYGCSREIYHASRHAIELRHPYRDRRLVEFVLSLPAYQLYYGGFYKMILRNAMKDILPELIRTRRQPTSLLSVLLRGVEREKTMLQTAFQIPETSWRKFVLADWLWKSWNEVDMPNTTGRNILVSWLCVSYETWAKLISSAR